MSFDNEFSPKFEALDKQFIKYKDISPEAARKEIIGDISGRKPSGVPYIIYPDGAAYVNEVTHVKTIRLDVPEPFAPTDYDGSHPIFLNITADNPYDFKLTGIDVGDNEHADMTFNAVALPPIGNKRKKGKYHEINEESDVRDFSLATLTGVFKWEYQNGGGRPYSFGVLSRLADTEKMNVLGKSSNDIERLWSVNSDNKTLMEMRKELHADKFNAYSEVQMPKEFCRQYVVDYCGIEAQRLAFFVPSNSGAYQLDMKGVTTDTWNGRADVILATPSKAAPCELINVHFQKDGTCMHFPADKQFVLYSDGIMTMNDIKQNMNQFYSLSASEQSIIRDTVKTSSFDSYSLVRTSEDDIYNQTEYERAGRAAELFDATSSQHERDKTLSL